MFSKVFHGLQDHSLLGKGDLAAYVGTGSFGLLFTQSFVGQLDDPALTQLRIFECEYNLRAGTVSVTYEYDPVTTVPEPSTLLLTGFGIAAAAIRKRLSDL